MEHQVFTSFIGHTALRYLGGECGDLRCGCSAGKGYRFGRRASATPASPHCRLARIALASTTPGETPAGRPLRASRAAPAGLFLSPGSGFPLLGTPPLRTLADGFPGRVRSQSAQPPTPRPVRREVVRKYALETGARRDECEAAWCRSGVLRPPQTLATWDRASSIALRPSSMKANRSGLTTSGCVQPMLCRPSSTGTTLTSSIRSGSRAAVDS